MKKELLKILSPNEYNQAKGIASLVGLILVFPPLFALSADSGNAIVTALAATEGIASLAAFYGAVGRTSPRFRRINLN